MDTRKQSNPPEGLLQACKHAGADGWKLAGTAFAVSIIGTIITIWIPEIVGKMMYKAPFNVGRAGVDGRLATLALGNVFAILCAVLVVAKPVRRQHYPFLYILMVVVTIFSVLAIAASISYDNSVPRQADDTLVAWSSWICVIVTLAAWLITYAAKIGEERIIIGYQPQDWSNKESEDYKDRVGEKV